MKKAIWIGVAASLLGLVSVSVARADEWNKKTVLTFSQPVEIPGQVLPAGTYTFKLADSMTDRHIVDIYNADETKKIATVMTVPNHRLKPTDQTVIKFSEVPAGSPEAIRAWFYPGNTLGQEFVYPKQRATLLAKASKGVVPAMAVEVASVDELKTAPIVAVTPDEQVVPVAAAIQTAPLTAGSSQMIDSSGVKQTASDEKQLPTTASSLPLVALFGLAAIGLGLGVIFVGKRSGASIR